MFTNIGGKIKAVASIVCWIGIVLSVLTGIVMMVAAQGNIAGILSGIVGAGVGALASWVGSFVLYGFGQIVENTDKMANK